MPAAPPGSPRRALDFGLLCGAVLASALVWRAVPRSYFYADDFLNLFRICDRPLAEYLFAMHGGHALLVRNAIFYACARLFGTDASAYFTLVLLTHLLNVGLLFRILRRATGSPWLAAFGAMLFGSCPLSADTLTWYSVYGQVLATTALLLVLDLASRAAARGRELTRGERLGGGALLVGGALSFGTGLGVALAMPLALALVLPAPERARWRLPLLGLWVAVPLVYGLARRADQVWAGGGAGADADAVTVLALAAAGWSHVLTLLLALLGYGGAHLLAGSLPLPAPPPYWQRASARSPPARWWRRGTASVRHAAGSPPAGC